MICTYCLHDSKLKDRQTWGACPNCKHKFAFEPTSGAKFTDMAFKKAIDRVSSQGKVRWHPDHLLFEVRRRKAMRPVARVLWGALLAVVALAPLVALGLWSGSVPLELTLAVGVVGIVSPIGAFFAWQGLEAGARVSREVLAEALRAWTSAHGRPAGLLEDVRPQLALPPELSTELEAYSFDRAVITERREIVDVLLANNFHFENNCAILTVGGYPENAFPILRKMLRQNPRITVFALHDATPAGCTLAHRLRTDPEWFEGVGRVVDVGLRPAHDRFFPGLREPAEGVGEVPVRPGISEADARWLRKWKLDLMVVRPEQLVKRLFKGIAEVERRGDGGGSGDAGGSGGDGTDGVLYLGMDASTSDGGGDSFG